MKGLQYAIDLVDRTFGPTIKKAKTATRGLDNAMRNVATRANAADAASNKSFGNIGRYAKKAAAAVGLVFALNGAISFANEVEMAGAKFQGFENAINFASGVNGAKNIAFLDKTINDLSLDMTGAYQGFQTLSGSMIGTALQGQATLDIFDGISTAARVMNLTGEQTQGTFLAVSQIASKGVVSMEELRQQLSERIPGAMKIAADAMGMGLPEFNKLVESGKLSSEIFLPRFAKAMKERFAGGVAEAVNSLQASKDRSNNAFTSMQRNIATSMESSFKAFNEFKALLFTLLPAVIEQIRPLIDAINNLGNGQEGINGLKTAMNAVGIVIGVVAEGLGFLIENWRIFTPLILSSIAALQIYKAIQLAAIAQTSIWTVVQNGLNAAFWANPIGIVVLAIVALVGGIIYAYKNFATFRGAIQATWSWLKGFGTAIKTYVVDRFHQMIEGISGAAKAIKLVFQGEWSKAWKAGQEATKNLVGIDTGAKFVANMKQVGAEAGKAYDKGWNEVNNKSLDAATGKAKTQNANDKLLGDGGATGAGAGGGGTVGAGATATVSGGGGSSTKHTTFNIKSMVQQLTVQTTNISGNPADLKKQLEKIFLELMGDLELRANS